MDKHYVEKLRIRQDGTVERKTIGRVKHEEWTRNECEEEFLSIYEFESKDFAESKIRGPLFFDLDTNLSTKRHFKELKHQVRKLYNCFARWKIEKAEITLGKKQSPMPFFLRNLKMGGRGEGEAEG